MNVLVNSYHIVLVQTEVSCIIRDNRFFSFFQFFFPFFSIFFLASVYLSDNNSHTLRVTEVSCKIEVYLQEKLI
jgi:hypothetical protein